MSQVKRIDSAHTTPTPQVTPSSSSSSATPATMATRTRQPLTAVVTDEIRSIDWNGHVPTAPRGPVTMTAAQIAAQLDALGWDEDDNKPAIPRPAPRQRQPIDRYDHRVIGFGAIHAHSAFGSAA